MLRRKKQQRRIEGTRTRRMQRSSPEASVECTARHYGLLHSTFFFLVCDRAQAAAMPRLAQPLQHRGAHAWHVQFMACLGCYCAHRVPLVVQLRLLPPRTSNARVCLILIRCRHCARLSFIVLHRMLFVDQYFQCASGCRGDARCLHMAWVWPASGNGRGRSEDAAEASTMS